MGLRHEQERTTRILGRFSWLGISRAWRGENPPKKEYTRVTLKANGNPGILSSRYLLPGPVYDDKLEVSWEVMGESDRKLSREKREIRGPGSPELLGGVSQKLGAQPPPSRGFMAHAVELERGGVQERARVLAEEAGWTVLEAWGKPNAV